MDVAKFQQTIEYVGMVVDATGVIVIVLGIMLGTGRLLTGRYPGDRYKAYRDDLGRAILLGLEILVAGDIIRTVAVTPTLTSVTILGLIVVIRTFLSFSMELELNGRWPWQKLPSGDASS